MTPEDTIEPKHIPAPYNKEKEKDEEELDQLFKLSSLKEAKNEFEKLFIVI